MRLMNTPAYGCFLCKVLIVLFGFLIFQTASAQQIIGVFPEMDGGFSLQPDTLPDVPEIIAPQNFWTTQVPKMAVVRDTGGRSHPRYLEFLQESDDNIERLHSITLGDKIKRNTQYTIQFFGKGDMDGDTVGGGDAVRVGISPNGTVDIVYSPWIINPYFIDWQPISLTLTTADVDETNGVVVFETTNNRLFYIDDFVLYPDTFDMLPPNTPDSIVINNTTLTTIDLSWSVPQAGVDSGGYVLVRFPGNRPDDDDDPNQNGIYAIGDTIFGAYNDGVILYIGTDTTFFDDNNLSPSSSYWYKLYAVDKAFNYSEEIIINAFTVIVYPEINITQNILYFGLVEVGDSSLNQSYTLNALNLYNELRIEPPAGFEVSLYPDSAFTSVLTILDDNGSIPDTTIYIRFKPFNSGFHEGQVAHITLAGFEEFNVSGIGHKHTPTVQTSNLSCSNIGHRSMNLNWDNGNGDGRLVIMNTINDFTNPVDSTYPAVNPAYAGTGEQIVFSGNANSFNVYNLSPETTYHFRVYEYNNMDTLTKYLTTQVTLNPHFCSTIEAPDFFEDFEWGELDNYFTDSVITLESGKWMFRDALIGESNVDKKRGAKAARIKQGGFIAMTFNKPNGFSSISVYHSNYRNDQNGRWVLSYSTDDGLSFHPLGVVNCNPNGEIEKAVFDLTKKQSNIRLLITVIGGTRVNIDDISIDDFILTTWTGYADTTWHNFDNWSFGLPDTIRNVFIPAVPQGNANNFPTISDAENFAHGLEIENGAKLFINPNATLTVLGTVITNDSLFILSDNTGHGSLIAYDTIFGDARIYQYTAGDNIFNFVSSPIDNAYSAVYDAASPANTLGAFNETSSTWSFIDNNTTLLLPHMKGYAYLTNNDKNVLFTGAPNNFNYTVEVSRTVAAPSPGKNLIANPYTSGLNWNSDSLITDAFAFRSFWSYKKQSFAAYNANAKIGTIGLGNIIPPMTSFFVQLDTPHIAETFNVSNHDRKHHTEAHDTFGNNQNIFRLSINKNGLSQTDEIVIAFFDPATDTLDIYDTPKMFSYNGFLPQIYTMLEIDSISINSNAPLLNNISFPLGFKTEHADSFIFKVNMLDYDMNMPVFLEDKLFATFTDLRTDTVYGFNSNQVNDTNRFKLHFFPCYLAVFDIDGDTLYCEDNVVDINLNSSESGVDYFLYKNGSDLGSPISGNGSALTWADMTHGYYTVRAVSQSIMGCFINMPDTLFVEEIPLPNNVLVEALTGTSYCEATAGVTIKFDNSQTTVFYDLFKDNLAYGIPVQGNSNTLAWDSLAEGIYHVVAYTNTTPQCIRYLSDTIEVEMIPGPEVKNVTGSGNYCEGYGGWVNLDNSDINVKYQLKRGNDNEGFAHDGTGVQLQWTSLDPGDYFVIATDISTNCSMPMSDTILINEIPAPLVFSHFSSGPFCSGQGIVGLENSETDVYYQLYDNFYQPVGAPIDGIGDTIYWTGLDDGFYKAIAFTVAPPNCNVEMFNFEEVVIGGTSPVVFDLTGGGAYCAGGSALSVVLNGSEFYVNYQLYKDEAPYGNVVFGNGMALTWPSLPDGSYFVIASHEDPPYCSIQMNNIIVIEEISAPTIFNLTGNSGYCAGTSGTTLTLDGSQTGVNYQLFRGIMLHGAPVAGTGNPLEWTGLTTGTYSVTATYDAPPNCSEDMNGIILISEINKPQVYNLSSNGVYCEGTSGTTLTLNGSQLDVSYQLYQGASTHGVPLAGTGSALQWTNITAGSYTVVATLDALPHCEEQMNGNVTVSEVSNPIAYTLSTIGQYCEGTTGTSVTLNNSQSGVNYQLYEGLNLVGSAIPGTGSSLQWNNQTEGTYSVTATLAAAPYCSTEMSNTVSIVEMPKPAVQQHPDTTVCPCDVVDINIVLDPPGATYSWTNTNIDIGLPASGTSLSSWAANCNVTGNSISGIIDITPSLNGCFGNSMTFTLTISPSPNTYNLTGGGAYCVGQSGLSVSLDGSQTGVTYQLKKNGVNEGMPQNGTTYALAWHNLTAGTYTVQAIGEAPTYCSMDMSGSIDITEIDKPQVFNLSGGGNYCEGSSGQNITLSGSQIGVNYQLYEGATTHGSPLPGTGSPLSWTDLTAGSYTVLAVLTASPNCEEEMNGTVVINEIDKPQVFNLSSNGDYCEGTSGTMLTTSGSQTGVSYQLYQGAIPHGTPLPGTGNTLQWSSITTGNYTVVAVLDASPNCEEYMSGNITVNEINKPIAYSLSSTGEYCEGTSGTSISLNGSQTGVNYQLYSGINSVGTPLNGNGSPLQWNNMTAGTYSVVAALDALPACTQDMANPITITELPLHNVDAGTDQSIVYGSATTLAVNVTNGSGNYNYNWEPIASVESPNNATTNTVILYLNTEFIIYVYDVNAGCTQSDTVNVTVFGGPLLAEAQAAPVTVCEGDDVSLTAIANGGTGSYDFVWSSQPPGFSSYSSTATANPTVSTTYTVVIDDGNSSQTATVSVTVADKPAIFNLSNGGNYCAGTSGLSVTLSGSENGINYQLNKNDIAEGQPLAGDGNALTWPNLTAGNYTVTATSTIAPYCSVEMNNTVEIHEVNKPVVFNLSGTGAYCEGSGGLNISLSGSQTGVNYQLYDGLNAVGSVMAGTGNALEWPNTGDGSYSVTATLANSPYCSEEMNGTVEITEINKPTVFNLSGGLPYCEGSSGSIIYLSGSQTGVNYQLYEGLNPLGNVVSGTGSPLQWTDLTVGTYTVVAVLNTQPYCEEGMNGALNIIENPLPIVDAGPDQNIAHGTSASLNAGVSGGSGNYSFSWEPASLLITPDNQATQTTLLTTDTEFIVLVVDQNTSCEQRDTVNVFIMGTTLLVEAIAQPLLSCAGDTVFLTALVSGGSGSYSYAWSSIPAGFTAQTRDTFALPLVNTTYTLEVYDGYNTVSDDIVVTVHERPQVYNLSGGGNYCIGTNGLTIFINSSQTNVDYQLYEGTTPVGIAAQGTGANIVWPDLLTGSYTVVATFTTAPYCSILMSGTAIIDTYPETTVSFDTLPDFCADSDMYLLTGAPAGGTFSGTAVSNNYFYPLNAGAGQFILTYSFSDVFGCTTHKTQTATVYALPDVTLASFDEICINESPFPLYGGTPSGGYYLGNGVINDSIFPDSVGPGLHNISYWYVDTNMCKNSDLKSIQINPFPASFTLVTNGQYCEGMGGTSLTLDSSVTGVNYQLYMDGTPFGSPLAGIDTPLTWDSLLTGQYYIWGYYPNTPACESFMNNVVMISETPSQPIDLGPDTVLCHNETITFSVHVGYTYHWIILPDDTIAHTHNLTVDMAMNGLGTQTYVVLLIDHNNCLSTDTINITFENCPGIYQEVKGVFSVYPNPTKDIINIAYKNVYSGQYSFDIYNMLNQKVFSELMYVDNKTGSFEFDVKRLVKGIYTLTISSNDNVVANTKIVIH